MKFKNGKHEELSLKIDFSPELVDKFICCTRNVLLGDIPMLVMNHDCLYGQRLLAFCCVLTLKHLFFSNIQVYMIFSLYSNISVFLIVIFY